MTNNIVRTALRPLVSRLRERAAVAGGAASAGTVTHGTERVLQRARPASTSPQIAPGTPGWELWQQVATIGWYHTMELPHGIVTPGAFDHRGDLDAYHFPASLTGKRCLDVATFDGFWAFQMERQGAAAVIAVDLERREQLDLPPTVRERMSAAELAQPIGRGFNLARTALGSGVERHHVSVYDLSPRRLGGRFDFVFCGNLLLHLMSPAKAVAAIRSVTAGEAIFAEVYDPELERNPVQPVLRYLGGQTNCTWWMPSLTCLLQIIRDAGFTEVNLLDTFRVQEETAWPHWQAVIRAKR